MKKQFQIILLCLSALIIVLLISGCSPAATEEPVAPTTVPVEEEEMVVLRIGGLSDEDVECWNLYGCGGGIWRIGYLYQEGFTDPGPHCDGVPLLAESWEHSDDYLTWTINLMEGITFSDGTPVDAQTVVDFNTWQASTSWAYGFQELEYMESIVALDDLTVEWKLTHPIQNSPDYIWLWLPLFPPDFWSEQTEETMYTLDYDPPIGTGPYVVTEHVPGEYIIFDARPDYYRGKPPIDRVIYQVYGNTEAIVGALLSGEIDATYWKMPPSSFDQLTGQPNITIEERPPGLIYYLVFNMYNGEAVEPNRHPAIEDPTVREAIDYAIDKQNLVDIALLGHGVTCPTDWHCGPAEAPLLHPGLEVTPFDLEKANQILQDAGYVDTDGDGVRETADGQPLELRILFPVDVPPAHVMAESIRGWLGEIGIAVEETASESATLNIQMKGERDFDMGILAWEGEVDPSGMVWWYSCGMAEAGANGGNRPGYCNEEMDDLILKWYVGPGSEQERMAALREWQERWNEERNVINLAGQKMITAWRADRFDFPENTCGQSAGQFSSYGLMNADVKEP